MLRIHFTSDDIAKLRVAQQPDPLWETVLSLNRFQRGDVPLVFGKWHREALARSRRSTLQALLPFVPGGYFPDFLNPAEGALGVEAGLDAVMSTPRTRLRTEMALLGEALPGPMPLWMRQLADGDGHAMRILGEAMRRHHAAVIAPYWTEAQAHIDADRAKRSRAFLEGGCEAVLNSFLPMMCWRPPVLEVSFSVDQDLYLQGRGLTLVPSYFSWHTPDSLKDPGLTPVLVYPVEHDLALSARIVPGASLAALVGGTRAAILASVGTGRTTGELARRVGVSAGAISQHTLVLREARLIRSTRTGKAVLHTITPLGTSVLAASDY